jgi:transcriptional regulator with XRE-family HTH domain
MMPRTPVSSYALDVAEQFRLPMGLGDVIRRQRELAELPLRQLAAMAGISNPYLSQIERGLRAPSDQVLEGIAQALNLSADALYDQAEALSPRRTEESPVIEAIEVDPDLTGRQRQALIEVYRALTAVTLARRRRGSAR